MQKYTKPAMEVCNMALHPMLTSNCKNADDYWWPTDMGDGHIIFVPEMETCTTTPSEYMEQTGDDDKACLYASTWDGTTFNGS